MAARKPLVLISGVQQELATTDSLDAPVYTLIKKTSDQSKSTDTVLANDTALLFTMAANTKYSIRIRIYGVAPATPGFKWGLTGPASPTLLLIEQALRAPAATAFTVSGTTGSSYPTNQAVTGNATSHFYLELDVVVQNGANSATFAFQWAQNASNGSAAIVRAGSYIEYSSF